jgi:predicted RNase H-like nuclease (RuvC/YqgF family)
MEAGERELKKAFEDVTTQNVRTIQDYTRETRKMVRALSDEVGQLKNMIVTRDEEIAQLRKQIALAQARIYVGGT